MHRKTLSELNLLDNFLFCEILGDEEYGREVAKIILETILRREVRVRKVSTEKVILPSKGVGHIYHVFRSVREKQDALHNSESLCRTAGAGV